MSKKNKLIRVKIIANPGAEKPKEEAAKELPEPVSPVSK